MGRAGVGRMGLTDTEELSAVGSGNEEVGWVGREDCTRWAAGRAGAGQGMG